MERVVKTGYKPDIQTSHKDHPRVVSIGKPPWVIDKRSGKLERMILQLGSGRGNFSEVTGIPRSMGCIGNNHFILRRAPLTAEEVEKVLEDFEFARGREVWITNYDDIRDAIHAAKYARGIGIANVYTVIRLEDMGKISEVDLRDINVIVELDYTEENLRSLESLNNDGIYGALIVLKPEDYPEFHARGLKFDGILLIDVLYPPNPMFMDESFLSMKMIPVDQKANHPCMSGMLAVTGDGYVVPCPLIRSYVLGDLRRDSLIKIARKRKLRAFWRILENIEECSTCPLKGVCHDCRAINYQVTGDVLGVEYCRRELAESNGDQVNSRMDL